MGTVGSMVALPIQAPLLAVKNVPVQYFMPPLRPGSMATANSAYPLAMCLRVIDDSSGFFGLHFCSKNYKDRTCQCRSQ